MGRRYGQKITKHLVSVCDDTWSYIVEQAENNKIGISDFIDRTFNYMRENEKVIKINYCICTKGEKNGNKTK